MLQRLVRAAGLVVLLAALQACGAVEAMSEGSSGGSYDYGTLEVPLGVAPAGSVALTVIDERPYVVNGEEDPTFVGTLPGSYRQAIRAETASGRPLAAHISDALAAALGREGAEVSPVTVGAGTSTEEALAALRATGAQRLIVIQMREWQTKAEVRVEAQWHFEATVHDRAGGELARRITRGVEGVGVAGVTETGERVAVSALAERLARLFADPAMAAALEGT